MRCKQERYHPAPGDVVVARGVGIRFGARTIWRDATFCIHAGEFITILGPNGAGKSTLLRLLLGLQAPSVGAIAIFGQAPKRGNSLIGYVPQRRTLSADLLVRAWDFVSLGLDGAHWGFPLPFVAGQHKRAAVQDVLEAVGATDYAHRPVGKLSGGEQQRLLLAQALLGHPRLLLLDEPLASLDLRHQGAIAQLVAQVAQARGITVLLVAHDINPLLTATDRVLYVAQGQVCLGTPDDIITTEHLSRLYDAPIEVVRDRHGRVLVFGQEQTMLDPIQV